jgi:hypothetical protein
VIRKRWRLGHHRAEGFVAGVQDLLAVSCGYRP